MPYILSFNFLRIVSFTQQIKIITDPLYIAIYIFLLS